MRKGLIGWPNQNPKSQPTEPLTHNASLAAWLSAYTLTIPPVPLSVGETSSLPFQTTASLMKVPPNSGSVDALNDTIGDIMRKKLHSAGGKTPISDADIAAAQLPMRQRRRRSTAATFFLPLWEMDVPALSQQRGKVSFFRLYRNRQHTLSANSHHASRFASSDPPSDDGSASAAIMPLITKLDKYSNAELKEYRQIFNMFDTDRSGAIGLDELENAIQNLGLDPKQIDVEMLMREADKRGNQQIDFDEFCEVMKATSEKTQSWNEVIKQCFDVFNRSETGFISFRDFEFVLRELGEFCNTRLVEEIFAEFDVNNDRIIDFDEFSFLVKSYLIDEDVV